MKWLRYKEVRETCQKDIYHHQGNRELYPEALLLTGANRWALSPSQHTPKGSFDVTSYQMLVNKSFPGAQYIWRRTKEHL